MQSDGGEQELGQRDCHDIALLTRKEKEWLLGNPDLPKPYRYRLKSSIKKKIQTFMNHELPLLIKNNLISYDAESLETRFGDGTFNGNNSSLGKAKVPGPNPGQGFLIFRKGARNEDFEDLKTLPNTVRSLPNTVRSQPGDGEPYKLLLSCTIHLPVIIYFHVSLRIILPPYCGIITGIELVPVNGIILLQTNVCQGATVIRIVVLRYTRYDFRLSILQKGGASPG